MDYLSGSSSQLKSGTVSALSVLVYQDVDICLSTPNLVPSLLSLLHTKVVELIKVSVLLIAPDSECWYDFAFDASRLHI